MKAAQNFKQKRSIPLRSFVKHLKALKNAFRRISPSDGRIETFPGQKLLKISSRREIYHLEVLKSTYKL